MSPIHTPTPWRSADDFDYILGPDGPNGPTYIATIETSSAPDRHKCSAPRLVDGEVFEKIDAAFVKAAGG